MSEENYEDIDSLITTKSEKSGGESAEVKAEPDTWYEARLLKIKPYDKKSGKFTNKNLRWIFEMQGGEFTTEYNGQPQQQWVMTSTSTFMAPGTRLCQMYCDITGKSEEDIENDKISIKSLVGKPCFVMIEKTPKDDGGEWVNIKAIKSANSKVVKKAAKQIVSADGVNKPEDIQFDAEPVIPVTKDTTSQFTAEEEEIFKDLVS